MAEVKRMEYKLDAPAIVEITESIGQWLKDHKMQSRNRTVFMLESILLDVKAHYEEPVDVTVSIIKKLGHTTIKTVYNGEEFNPGETEEGSLQTQLFLANLGLVPCHSYRNKRNEITLEVPRNPLGDESLLLIAVIAAVAAGILRPVIPETLASAISVYILGTLSGVFMDLLGVFAGILIFFSILSGVCGMGNISDLSSKGKYMLTRTMLYGILGAVLGGLLLIPFFSFTFGSTDSGAGIGEIYSMIRDIIPSDPVSPFMNGNMLQISLIAFITGSFIILLGNRVTGIHSLVVEGNTLLLSIVELICRLLSFYIFADLTELLWENGFGVMITIWKPLLICITVNLIYVLVFLTAAGLKYRIKIPALFKKIFPSFIIGLTTASSMAAFGTMLEINETKLGIDKGYSSFATPLKNQLHVLNDVTAFIIVIYYITEYSGINVNPFWFVNACIVLFLINLAIPPVSGGMLICIGVVMDQLGIPSSCLGLAATLLLIFDFIITSSKIVLIHTEEIFEADHFGLLNRRILLK